MSSRISVALSDELREALEKYSKEMGESLSTTISEMLEHHILGPEVYALRKAKAEKTLADIKPILLKRYKVPE